MDDLLIVASLAFSIALAAVTAVDVKTYKVNRHIWDIPPTLFSGSRLYVWIGQLCFVACAGLVKISILLFYRRLSNSFSRGFRIATYIGVAYNILFMLTFFILLMVECDPISSYWLAFDPVWLKAGHTFHCRVSEHVGLPAASALSVIGDAYSTLIPLCLVYTLDMPRRQKRALYCLFALGFLVVAAGIIRTYYLNYLINETYDNSWALYKTWIWALVELFVSIFAASAPALKPFFRKFFIDPITTFNSGSRYGESNNANHSGKDYNKWRSEKELRGGRGPVLWSQDSETVRGSTAIPPHLDLEKIGVAVTKPISEGEEDGLEMQDYPYQHGRRLSRNAGTQTTIAAARAPDMRRQMSIDLESDIGVSRQPSQTRTTSSTEWILPPMKVPEQASDPLRTYRAEIEALPPIPSETIAAPASDGNVRRTASLEQQRYAPRQPVQRPSTAVNASESTASQFARKTPQPVTDRSYQRPLNPGPLAQNPIYNGTGTGPELIDITPSHQRRTSQTNGIQPAVVERHPSRGSVRVAHARARQIQIARAQEMAKPATPMTNMTISPSIGGSRQAKSRGDADDEIDYTILDPPIVAGAIVGSGREESVRASSRLSSDYGENVATDRNAQPRPPATKPFHSPATLSDEEERFETPNPISARDRGDRRTWNTNTFLDRSEGNSPNDSDGEPEHQHEHNISSAPTHTRRTLATRIHNDEDDEDDEDDDEPTSHYDEDFAVEDPPISGLAQARQQQLPQPTHPTRPQFPPSTARLDSDDSVGLPRQGSREAAAAAEIQAQREEARNLAWAEQQRWRQTHGHRSGSGWKVPPPVSTERPRGGAVGYAL